MVKCMVGALRSGSISVERALQEEHAYRTLSHGSERLDERSGRSRKTIGAKYYSLTKLGGCVLSDEQESWDRLAEVMAAVRKKSAMSRDPHSSFPPDGLARERDFSS